MSHETRDKSQEYAAARGQNPRVDSNGIAIKVTNVSKSFKLPHDKQNSIKGGLISLVKNGKRTYEKQEVLKDISFEIKKGEFFGIVGRNGSGKSTLLKMLAGIYTPTSGHIQINGSLTPFIELGVGFNPELTGRENVYLNGALLGFNRKQMAEMYEDIVDFAELERFMDQKLKNYSSGMQVRLAFSIAIRADSPILLLDEVLAVGDSLFQKKCYTYFKQLKKDKKTVILVSHDSNALLEYCDKGILLEKGEIVIDNKITRVVNEYADILNGQEDLADSLAPDKKKRWGTGEVKIDKVFVSKHEYIDADTEITVSVEYKANKSIEKPTYGIIITDENEQRVFVSNTTLKKISTKSLASGEISKAFWTIPNAFNSGRFFVAPAVASEDGTVIYDWIEEGCTFRVRKKLQSSAFINIEHDILVKGQGK